MAPFLLVEFFDVFEVEDFFDELIEVGVAGNFGATRVHDEVRWFPGVVAFAIVVYKGFVDEVVGDMQGAVGAKLLPGVEIGGEEFGVGEDDAGFFQTFANGGGDRVFGRQEFAADAVPTTGEGRVEAPDKENLVGGAVEKQSDNSGGLFHKLIIA